MMNLNKMIAKNKKCACAAMIMIGAIAGWATAKLMITHCCCAESFAHKAKKAIKCVEEKMMP